MHILGKAGHRLGPQGLQPVFLGGEIGVAFGVAGHMAAVLAQHVIGKEVLRMAGGASAHRDQEQVRPLGNRLGDGMGHDLDFHRKSPGLFQRLALGPDQLCGFQGLAHRLEASGPGALRWDQPDMAADGDAVVGQRPHGLQ